MEYAIAYRGKNGASFFGMPFVLNDFDGPMECLKKCSEMKLGGYLDVTPFCVDEMPPEEIGWDYVEENYFGLST